MSLRFLANVNLCSGSLYAIAVPSVCRLPVTLVHPSGVNPAGDAGDTSPSKIGLRGTVMHYVPPPNLASNLVLYKTCLV